MRNAKNKMPIAEYYLMPWGQVLHESELKEIGNNILMCNKAYRRAKAKRFNKVAKKIKELSD